MDLIKTAERTAYLRCRCVAGAQKDFRRPYLRWRREKAGLCDAEAGNEDDERFGVLCEERLMESSEKASTRFAHA